MDSSEQPVVWHNLAVEIGGTITVMIAGAFVGMLIPLKGEGAVTTVSVCAILAWVIWTRRRKPFARTSIICLGMLVFIWPITFVLLDWLHKYF
jgi:Mg2+/citrate symporter